MTTDLDRKDPDPTPRGGSGLIHAALALFVVSLFLPALRIAGDLIVGRTALFLSFYGSVYGFFDSPEAGQWPACLLGALANLLFVFCYGSLVLRCHFQRGLTYTSCKAVALSTCALMLAVHVPLWFGSEEYSIHIGHIVWVASSALLAIAAHKNVPPVKQSENSD